MPETARERVPNMEQPHQKQEGDKQTTYDAAEAAATKAALEASGAKDRNESAALARQLSEKLHGTPKIEAVPTSAKQIMTSESQQAYAMARAEQGISREWQALSEEVGLDLASLKQVEARYDKIDAKTKEALGLPEHFDEIVTSPGKKIGKGWLGHIVKEFTGRGKRYDVFSKAQDLVASQNPEKRQWEK